MGVCFLIFDKAQNNITNTLPSRFITNIDHTWIFFYQPGNNICMSTYVLVGREKYFICPLTTKEIISNAVLLTRTSPMHDGPSRVVSGSQAAEI